MSENETDSAALNSLLEKNQTARDSAILTLGSATLGFTITIFTSIYNGQALWLVIATWIFLVISILTLLISFGTAAKASDKILLHGQAVKTGNQPKQHHLAKRSRFYFKLTQRLNRWSIGTYFVALICFVAFAICNVMTPKEDMKVSEQKIELKVLVEKGALPSRASLPEVPTPQAETPAATSTQQTDTSQQKE